MIGLEQARELVTLLENGKQEEADAMLVTICQARENPIINQVGSLTRDLHDSLTEFKFDSRMSEIAKEEIPDARDRLEYVIAKTESAANRTMDAVERSLPIAESLHQGLLLVRPTWNELMKGRIDLNEFKALCHHIDDLLTQIEGNSTELTGQLTDILMAQDFQDLTGQIIKKVITLVQEVEGRLVEILTAFGQQTAAEADAKETKKISTEAEGPIINPHERDDAVSSQDDVDDLLSSLGF